MCGFVALQQGVMCSGRRGGDEDNDGDGKGNDNVKALLRIAKGVFLGVRLSATRTHSCSSSCHARVASCPPLEQLCLFAPHVVMS